MASYKDAINHRLSAQFPAIAKWPVTRTSDATEAYNCLAFAAGETRRPWWPLPVPVRGIHWPTPVKPEDENTVHPVLEGFEAIGFEWCEKGDYEPGFEKIAIYVRPNQEPSHAAIQRENGLWQSKLGDDVDIEHALESLESSEEFGESLYGRVRYFMRRKRTRP